MTRTVSTALVKRHYDIRAESVLYLHGKLGRKKVLAPVEMRMKQNAVVGDIIEFCERKHLKTAAVGKNGLIPTHKFMQSARPFNELMTGAHI